VFGVDPLHADEAWRARVGVVLQSWRDHARWTPRALLDHLGAYYLPFSADGRVRPVSTDDLLELVGLRDAADQRILTLALEREDGTLLRSPCRPSRTQRGDGR
jgi:ABC-2 type transport system ATP-binding protein